MSKIILDLYGGTGSWSKPYKDAGYDVRVFTKPDHDIHYLGLENMIDLKNEQVYGILAAPPCTMFSLARTTAKTPRDLKQAMEAVEDTLRIVWEARHHNKLAFWAIENPKALLRQFLGKPPFSFDASEFGEKYNKATDIWGYFNSPKKQEYTHHGEATRSNARVLPAIPGDYKLDPDMTKRQIQRSITPEGFAQAFFRANQ